MKIADAFFVYRCSWDTESVDYVIVRSVVARGSLRIKWRFDASLVR
jgi:hypothetical protein